MKRKTPQKKTSNPLHKRYEEEKTAEKNANPLHKRYEEENLAEKVVESPLLATKQFQHYPNFVKTPVISSTPCMIPKLLENLNPNLLI